MKFGEAMIIYEDFKADLRCCRDGDILLLTQEEYSSLIESFEIIEHVIVKNRMGEKVLPPCYLRSVGNNGKSRRSADI